MSRLVTAPQVQQWAREAGAGPRFLLAAGFILTPGAIDAARGLGIQVLYPGSSLDSLLRQWAEEMAEGPVGKGGLAELERQVIAKINE